MTEVLKTITLFDGNVYSSREEESSCSADNLQVVKDVIGEIARTQVWRIDFEGCPIYAFPNPDASYRSQQWMSKAFKSGINLGDVLVGKLAEKMQGLEISHWIMVDDVNNVPSGESVSDTVFEDTLENIQNQVGPITIFENPSAKTSFSESHFKDDHHTSCASMDACFQITQMEEAFQHCPPAHILFLKVHPDGFMSEQSSMFENLLKEMKNHQLFSGISKQLRIKMIEALFMHIWINDEGEATHITRPKWNGSRFVFEEVFSDETANSI